MSVTAFNRRRRQLAKEQAEAKEKERIIVRRGRKPAKDKESENSEPEK